MDALLGRAWWMLALRGAAGILFGLLALFWPGLTLLLLVAMFAAYALIGGIAAVSAAIRNRSIRTDWWIPLLLGLCMIASGVIALAAPGVTALVLITLMGANAIVTGVFDLIAWVRLKRRGRTQWLLLCIGSLSILFGIFVLVYPGAGALALVWMIGTYAIVTGALLLVLGLGARNWRGADLRDKQNAPLHS
ncbi:HdeD family acid-resistance protein [Caballeronia grimmiae]|uniref:Membrane protein n=1 Tax=Caballeronia grimmiae TaxID=1071679 RepID=A0A069P870_9BURK|nr:HdeD family acid-resistance protein [Caballeronia grimmiae]KDR33476.1 membrane protein [Caballeronia grimmiae]GGD71950.1 membrane protein [Caballeronia grimmiae]